ncbi:hypothetical protein P6B95_37435 [Streptomyces atratus]|uniref:hypothetical protein n=1 Tax=Streptomyces atratus TaxID=1893 RepID=UPI002AC33B9F|nr:hypothetical protein [Streptomyces atratus]WPW32497.1 hypothetical protein P6B95_37435 [Streptomyces atratus]
MRTRTLSFGLYADERGLAWARNLVREAVASRSARLVEDNVAHTVFGSELTTADVYGFLAEQWVAEHPGESSGERVPVELSVRVVCSLRTWRAIRKAVIRALCPEGPKPHACRVPWIAA